MEQQTLEKVAQQIANERWFKRNYLADGDYCFTVSSYIDTIKTKIGDVLFFEHGGEILISDRDAIYEMVVDIAKSWDMAELERDLYGD